MVGIAFWLEMARSLVQVRLYNLRARFFAEYCWQLCRWMDKGALLEYPIQLSGRTLLDITAAVCLPLTTNSLFYQAMPSSTSSCRTNCIYSLPDYRNNNAYGFGKDIVAQHAHATSGYPFIMENCTISSSVVDTAKSSLLFNGASETIVIVTTKFQGLVCIVQDVFRSYICATSDQ